MSSQGGKYAEEEEEKKVYLAQSDDDSESETESEDEDVGDIDDLDMPVIRTGRRGTIVAAAVEVEDDWTPPSYDKTPEERALLAESITANVLFSKLDDRELEIVVSAMQRMSFAPDDDIIRQGDDGDMFYVLEEGTADIFVEGVGRVMTVEGGVESARNYFGELALLYDAPRAATVTATSRIAAWALDRVTFKRILQDATQKQRQLYRGFLEQVSILQTLSTYERLTIADALRPRQYAAGDIIISEGKEGSEFFLVEDGEVKCTKDIDGEDVEVSNRLGCGDFFGELALLTNDTRKATVTAVRDTRCLLLDRATFKRLLGPLEALLRQNMDLYNEYVESASSRK